MSAESRPPDNGRTGRAGRAPLRFGLISADTTLAVWQRECLRHLLAMPESVLAARAVPDRNNTPTPSRDGLFRKIYGWPDLASDAAESLPHDVLQAVPALPISSLGQADLDFVLCFADPRAIGNPTGLARYGVWVFSFGD